MHSNAKVVTDSIHSVVSCDSYLPFIPPRPSAMSTPRSSTGRNGAIYVSKSLRVASSNPASRRLKHTVPRHLVLPLFQLAVRNIACHTRQRIPLNVRHEGHNPSYKSAKVKITKWKHRLAFRPETSHPRFLHQIHLDSTDSSLAPQLALCYPHTA